MVIEAVATDELADGLISAGIDLSVVIPTASDTRGTLPLAPIASLWVLCPTVNSGVLSSAPSTTFGRSPGGRKSIALYPGPRSFSQNVPFHTLLGRLRTMSSGARSRRAARAARARWTRSVQSVSREGRVRTMRKDRIGLESRYQSPRARTDSGRTKGTRSGIERGGGDGKHVRVPFPRRFTNQPCGDSFDAIRNRVALFYEIGNV